MLRGKNTLHLERISNLNSEKMYHLTQEPGTPVLD